MEYDEVLGALHYRRMMFSRIMNLSCCTMGSSASFISADDGGGLASGPLTLGIHKELAMT